jgi:hypothetical protein
MQRSSFISDSKKPFGGGRGSLPLLPGGEGLSAPAAFNSVWLASTGWATPQTHHQARLAQTDSNANASLLAARQRQREREPLRSTNKPSALFSASSGSGHVLACTAQAPFPRTRLVCGQPEQPAPGGRGGEAGQRGVARNQTKRPTPPPPPPPHPGPHPTATSSLHGRRKCRFCAA